MKSKRSREPITLDDLRDLYAGSVQRLESHFIVGRGRKWEEFYNIRRPIAVALCQGAAMHYHDRTNGVKDFDVWFFYPFNRKHLPYRTIWNWDYTNPKFGRHPAEQKYRGRRVDVLVRSIRNHVPNDPVRSIHQYLKYEKTDSSRELAQKAVVMLHPGRFLGQVIWYRGELR